MASCSIHLSTMLWVMACFPIFRSACLNTSLGCALMIEGIMGGMYHMCPNDANYQFGRLLGNVLHAMVAVQPAWLPPICNLIE